MIWFLILLAALVVFSYVYLRGEDLSYLDAPNPPMPAGEPSAEHHEVVASLGEFSSAANSGPRKDRVRTMRELMDAMSDDREFVSEFRAVDHGGVRGEWVLAPGVDARRRVLYIHGGAWIAGSPKSHRAITNRLSVDLNAAVFSLDYRLMPEYRRMAGIFDCQNAYRWILDNGPDGKEELDFLLVGGDSAGGSLTLVTLAWARDQNLRLADASIAFSPSTDVTMTSPSLFANIPTDPMLGPAFGSLSKVPKLVLWWSTWVTSRMRPSDPLVSPLRGDLSGLPPILVLVSEQEMLFDDAYRYVTKAQAAGSPVELQSWPYMVHVWPIFNPELPEAEEAFANIAEFVDSASGTLPGENAA
ncbi:MAG: alpha/beta hydrolase [Halioglobus sp.]